LDEQEHWERFERWQQTAYLCTIIANANRNEKINPIPFEPKDFNPISALGEEKQEKKKPQTPEEMAYVAKMLVAAMGGKVQ
jgi:hypothetical protein